jgi:DNA-binding winged helix-turn-helix (wHTH) protein
MSDNVYRFGEFAISEVERRLFKGTESLALTPQLFDALLLLVRKPGTLVPKAEFMRVLWPDVHVAETNLTNIVVQLRKLLGREAIETVSKFGYRLAVPVTAEPGISAEVYAGFVRGRDLMGDRSLDSIVQARDLFTICVAEDPHFATGWAWLGRAARLFEKFHSGRTHGLKVADAAFRRAFAIDPDLACAHSFYTQLQVDTGHSTDAMVRLAGRIKRLGDDPETMAGLVQVLRCCGLLQHSVAAHHRAVQLDPTVRTSVAHTYFLQGDYPNVFTSYMSHGYYLDAAAWAGMGQTEHAVSLLNTRLPQPDLSPFMSSMMSSLLAALEGQPQDVAALAESAAIAADPEGLFYFARHAGMLRDSAGAIGLIHRARLGGFCCSHALTHDGAFASMRNSPEFQNERKEACKQESIALEKLTTILGPRFLVIPA